MTFTIHLWPWVVPFLIGVVVGVVATLIISRLMFEAAVGRTFGW